ncbi:MAG: hypothetical protein IPN13_17055 [Bacteroidetes bacterium]|nr:hypothetical protein [Bacteroidota bacterium]
MSNKAKKVLLDQWSAIEMFCRVIEKFEKDVQLSDFKSNALITDYLDKCTSSNDDYYKKLAAEVNQIANKDFNLTPINEKRFFYISNDIRFGRSISLRETDKNVIEKYINHPIRLVADNPLWKTKIKQRKLEDTRWYLYYYEDYETSNSFGKKELVRSVVRTVVHFRPFAVLEQNGRSAKNDNKFVLHGTYSMIGEKEKFLQLHLMGNEGSVDTRYIFNIESTDFKFALGQYQNSSDEDGYLYSGFAILDSFGAVKRGSLSPKVFKQNAEEWNELPIYVRNYLNSSKCEIETPLGIKDSDQFLELLNNPTNARIVKAINGKQSFALHDENEIQLFRRKLYLYYSTASNPHRETNGKSILFWNHTIIDFTNIQKPGRLISKVKILDRLRQNKFPIYDAEMFRLHPGDPIIMVFRREGSKEPLTITLISDMNAGYYPTEFGCTFHDDWNKSMRLSPSILSLDPLFETYPSDELHLDLS